MTYKRCKWSTNPDSSWSCDFVHSLIGGFSLQAACLALTCTGKFPGSTYHQSELLAQRLHVQGAKGVNS